MSFHLFPQSEYSILTSAGSLQSTYVYKINRLITWETAMSIDRISTPARPWLSADKRRAAATFAAYVTFLVAFAFATAVVFGLVR